MHGKIEDIHSSPSEVLITSNHPSIHPIRLRVHSPVAGQRSSIAHNSWSIITAKVANEFIIDDQLPMTHLVSNLSLSIHPSDCTDAPLLPPSFPSLLPPKLSSRPEAETDVIMSLTSPTHSHFPTLTTHHPSDMS